MEIIKHRAISYIFSLVLIVIGIYFLVSKGLNYSTEFTGGTNIVFNTTQSFEENQSDIDSALEDEFNLSTNQSGYTLSLNKSFSSDDTTKLTEDLTSSIDNFELISLEVVEPSVGRELILKTFYAIGFSVLVIFVYVWYAFKNFVSSIAAIIAMLHDTIIILGFFAFFGYYFDAKIDLLFVTAVLTILSFSLYDTIVIFDKMREIYQKTGSLNYSDTINLAVSQTMVRSINNSLTSIIVLFALALFVQGSLFWFVLALLLGVIFGTYSSPFIAAPVFYDLRTYIFPAVKKRFKKK